jgi:hypothetical protein
MKNHQLKILLAFFMLSFGISCSEEDCMDDSDEDCVCIEIYQPVCGSDGLTYSNSCLAECAGVVEYTEGECEM